MDIALIGYGRWGKNLYNTLNKIETINNIYVCDPTLNEETSKLKILSLEEIKEQKEIKGVVVASPASTHFEITKTFLEAGKHVFCEKPLCFTENELNVLKNLVLDKKLILISGHTFLFNDSIKYLKNHIKKNKLKFRAVFGKYSSYGTNVKDVDVLWDFGPHVISIMNYVFDSKPHETNLYPVSNREDGKLESCYLNLKYEKPQTNVMFELSWLNVDKKREIDFNNYETLIKWDDLKINKPIQIYEKQFQKEEIDGVFAHFHNIENKITVPFHETNEPLVNEMKYFIDSITNEKHTNLISGIEFTEEVIKILFNLSQKI
jgi:predicted dehydrogenase